MGLEPLVYRGDPTKIYDFIEERRSRGESNRGRMTQDRGRSLPPLSDYIDHIDYIVRLVGADTVAVGSDWGGYPVNIKGIENAGEYQNIAQALVSFKRHLAAIDAVHEVELELEDEDPHLPTEKGIEWGIEMGVSRRTFLQGALAGGVALRSAGSARSQGAGPTDSDLPYLSIVQASELMRTKQLSPLELIQAVLKRIDEVEPRCRPSTPSLEMKLCGQREWPNRKS